MKKYNTRSDLALESLSYAIKDKDYRHALVQDRSVTIESFEILNKSELYPHDIGNYVEMIFDDYSDADVLIRQFQNQLQLFIKELTHKLDPFILYVGLGNDTLTSDAIGPRTLNHIEATHHFSLQDRHEKMLYDKICLSPGVMGKTGMETADIIESLVDKFKPDVIVVIDALCASDYQKICRVIQMNNVGIYPGSGIGNHRKSLTQTTLNTPVIAIGVPTVIHVSSLMNHVYSLLEGYFKESMEPANALKVSKRKTYSGKLSDDQKKLVLGEIGLLDDQKRTALFYEVFNKLEDQFVMSDKAIDYDIEMLSKIISQAINDMRY